MNSAMSKIINLMKIKKHQQAELEIYTELKKDPQSFDLNKILAMNFISQKKYNLAMASLSKCHEINPNDYDINVNLSHILNKIQDYKTALQYSSAALEINSDKPEVYHSIAHSYLYIPDLQKADFNVLKSIKLRGGLDSMEIMNYKDTLNLYTDILYAKGDEDSFRNVCSMLLNKGIHFGDIFRKLLRSDKKAILEIHLKTMEKSLRDIEKNQNLVYKNLTKSSIYSCFAEYYQDKNKEVSENYFIKSCELMYIDLFHGDLYFYDPNNLPFIKTRYICKLENTLQKTIIEFLILDKYNE